jgi:hypothetical protein
MADCCQTLKLRSQITLVETTIGVAHQSSKALSMMLTIIHELRRARPRVRAYLTSLLFSTLRERSFRYNLVLEHCYQRALGPKTLPPISGRLQRPLIQYTILYLH